ncbi:PilN domain-containing protein [Rhodoferax aquaticus]|uniref:PilN domain-containing protein n=1 Tax=Rhodoferax aquaticus TaxID=2527691 RepID=A0A515EV25_9BURK|nr:PilN domain-containing protein [Rhodoferax aquaticus]QDL56459.1 hypothetical protein EXZ61_21135 [Rhodoferax aquaticus]
MPQQINLCTPVFLIQKKYFSAQTMAAALGAFVLLGGTLCAAWVWRLDHTRAGYLGTMAAQSKEIESLQTAVRVAKAGAGPVDSSLVQQLQTQRLAVEQRTHLLQVLQEGVYRPGAGHSDRLQWVARSIPDTVWITQLTVDAGRFELMGNTLEPAALNAWVERLAQGPLLRGLELSNVKVERVDTSSPVPAGGAATPGVRRPMWSFVLLHVQPELRVTEGSTP